MVQERKIALLVDAENVSHHRIDQVMAAVKNNLGGLVTVKRIYLFTEDSKNKQKIDRFD